MMPRARRAGLLTLVALWFATSPLIAGAPVNPRPRLSAAQATQQAAAFARAFDVPVLEASKARFSDSTWVLRSGLSTVVIRDDTGQLLELRRPGERPGPGAKPVTKEQAIASAAHLLKVVGAPADVKLGEPKDDGLRWSFGCRRQTPQGVPYYDGRVSIVIDATGRVEEARLDWSPGAPSTHLSAEQAKEKAAAFAKAAGLPWDDRTTARLTYTRDDQNGAGATSWEVRCRGTGVNLGGDTGAILGFDRHGAATPSPGKEPPTKEEAIAAASRVLRLLGAASEAPPAATKMSGGGWYFAWARRTPDGVPYYGDETTATVVPAGEVVSVWLNWHSRPPASTKPKIPERRARRLALKAGRQAGRLDRGPHSVTAELEIVRPSDFGKAFAEDHDVPTRLTWAVVFTWQDTGSELTILIDAIDGKLVGISSGRAVPSDTGEGARPRRSLSPRVGLAAWVAIGPLVAGIVGAVAYLARRREERPAEEKEG